MEIEEISSKKLMDQQINLPLLGQHHINSFNYSFNVILPILHKYIRPIEIQSTENTKNIFDKMTIFYEKFELHKPEVETKQGGTGNNFKENLLPHEAREREMNYSAPLFANVKRKFANGNEDYFNVKIGNLPIMVKSDFCHLKGLDNDQCVKLKEDNNDFGGYFIVNGNEKLLRMISIPRRNYPIGFIRPSYVKKTKNCSEYAVQIKCVREDLTSQTMTFHYLNDGNCLLRLLLSKQEYLIPVGLILKSLLDVSDMYIYSKLLFDPANVRLKECIEVLIAESKKSGLNKQSQYLEYLGVRFRNLMGLSNNNFISNQEIGKLFIKEYIMINNEDDVDKFNAFCICIEKLYLLAFNQIKPDNMDSLLNHEVLLSGHLYMMIVKEKLEESLQIVKAKITKSLTYGKKKSDQILNINFIKSEFDAVASITKKIENFIATGNLISKSGLDLMQMGGYSIMAEKLNNMRYISHFRSIHRGQFFTEMKTTTPRKLLPDSWGFLCPVHTPDGSPCGLLNHIASGCNIITHQDNSEESKKLLIKSCSDFGMISVHKNTLNMSNTCYNIILDGTQIGFVEDHNAHEFVRCLRDSKIFGKNNVPEHLEIGFIPKTKHINSKIVSNNSFQFPGIFLFNCIARMTRRVKNLEYNEIETIGPIEQQYLHIAVLPEDIKYNFTTHQELNTTNFLSMVAGITPFCEYNQSPRNMYQCQMAKQTMGTPYFNYPHRIDNKTYRILFPQLPLVHSPDYLFNKFDTNPSGTNAVVAVLSYTGYDMEDAMILNKSSYERGLGHGSVYKSVTKILNETGKLGQSPSSTFRMLNFAEDEMIIKSSKLKSLPDYLGSDGLPYIGTQMSLGMVYLCFVDTVKNELVVHFYKDNEACIIDQIRIYNKNINSNEVAINFLLRFKRNPIIGDKFSSRHGQKGVMSFLWPQVNMPFTETGMVPDIIINPHAFPSRMTIGMLIESLAGKSGSMQGKFKSFIPFEKAPNDDIISLLGEELVKEGFNYNGTEILYSGVSGQQLKADIYIGVVYYQRLRHMVNDKAQARSTGPIDILTRQPVKGRKNNGGIRFGEMERDGLLAHGISYCLNDRLFKSSDYSEGYICECGSLITTHRKLKKDNADALLVELYNSDQNYGTRKEEIYCETCKNTNHKTYKVSIPYVLRYLTNELAGMNIKLKFKVNSFSN